METILLTGCLGFIGSHTFEEFLESKFNLIGIDSLTYAANQKFYEKIKNNFCIYKHDICDRSNLEKIAKNHKISKIVNFAAETHVDNSIKNSKPFLQTNILGVANLLELSKNNDIELIQISTDEVYGPAGNNQTFNEKSPLNPQNPYSATKASADFLIESYKNTYGIKAKIIRPSNNFGPRQHQEKLLSKSFEFIKKNKKIPIYGDGKQKRQWTYVKDTAKIIKKLIENNVDFEILNITSGYELTNIEIIDKICLLFNRNVNDVISYVKDRPGHDTRYSIDSSKMHSLIPFQFLDIETAIKHSFELIDS